ncbi:hypothetical protein [Leifsonia sp. Le1]|uniref:hypothetical protein n=1 Tax=Leifsonia sp. Le1 TaxID=3404918 RepID=UPI003EBC566A
MRSFTATAIGVAAAAATALALLESPASTAAEHPELYDPYAPVQPIAALDWEERPSIARRGQFSPVAVDVERLELVHAGMDLPSMRQSDGTPVVGLPYYFFGKDPHTGRYLPEYVALCIDIFHMSFHIEKDSDYYDLTRLVPADTAREIIDTVNAGVQLASEVGLDIRVDGSVPLTVTTDEAGEYLLAAQRKAWYLFAKNSLTHPLPHMRLDDLRVTRPANGDESAPQPYDLSEATADVEDTVRRYRSTPSSAEQTHMIDTRLVLSDADALDGFEVLFDDEHSTPDARDYVDVRIHRDGDITITERKPLDDDLTLAFTKEYPHGLGGGDYPYSAVQATLNDQTKGLISNHDEAAFSLSLSRTSPTVETPDEPEDPPRPPGAVDDEYDEEDGDDEGVEEPDVEDPGVDEPGVEHPGREQGASAHAANADAATTGVTGLPDPQGLAATGSRVADAAVVGMAGGGAAVLGVLALTIAAVRRRGSAGSAPAASASRSTID